MTNFFVLTIVHSAGFALWLSAVLYSSTQEGGGGEPARLTLLEWKDAEENVWVDTAMIEEVKDPLEKQLLGSFKLCYMAGKGNHHLVPVLIPVDTIPALRLLADTNIRSQAGVRSDNRYLFPNMMSSKDHASGWHCVKKVCLAAGVDSNLNATKMRLRASTYYASLEMSETERNLFYSHMGHSREVNQVYQCPQSISEIVKVGGALQTLEKRAASCNYTALIIIILY